MANEPNRAEEELKRYAEERRAQAPTELHPATRRMLQGEVGRVYGGSKKESVSWWKRVLLAPRFAWAMSLAVICGISILALRQPGRTREEAVGSKEQEKVLELTQRRKDAETQRDEKKEMDSAKPLADAAAVSVAPVTVAPAATTPAPVPVPAPTAAPVLPKPGMAGEDRSRAMREAPVKREPIAPQKALGGVAPVQQNERYFLNSAPQSKDKLEAAKNVLTRFTMQGAERNLVVVDADGSLYSGARVSQAGGTNAFVVSGTNRTLNQRVDFSGNYYRAPLQQPQVNLQQQTQNQIQNAQEQVRVQGQAVVDNKNQVPVDAQGPAPAQ